MPVNNFDDLGKIRVFLNVGVKNELHSLEIRTLTTDAEAIKFILEAAIQGKPLNVFPVFRNHLLALAKLAEEDIIAYDYDKGSYKFLEFNITKKEK